jgi:hypothetical protein
LSNSKYGPTLLKEFNDAGVAGLSFSWGEEGVVWGDGMPEDKKSVVLSVIEAHDPTATLPVVEVNPVDKLKDFLLANPDVAALLQGAK